jgi:STE24 endopeptidase
MQAERHRWGWLAAVGAAVGGAEAATAALRPRHGIVAARAVAVDEHFTAAELGRARRFGRPQLALAGLSAVLDAAVLARLARRPPGALAGLAARPVAGAAASGAAVSLVLTGTGLPVAAIMRRRALDAGLATQSWRGWAVDLVKGAVIGAGLAGAGAGAAGALMARYGERWWLPGGALAAAAAAGLTFAGPVVLDPVFNRFDPLGDGDTRDDVIALAGKAGVAVGNVFQVDASRRTSAANAYVNGLGRTKRVVLFDTLLERFTREETRLVVAHELAHVRHRDIWRSLVHLALVAPLGLRAADLLARRLDPAAGRAGAAPSVPALALAVGLVGALLVVPGNRLSRAVERRADSFALGLTDAPEAFTSFERRIVVANLADPDPPRWMTALLASHPPAVERIGIARAYAEGHRA